MQPATHLCCSPCKVAPSIIHQPCIHSCNWGLLSHSGLRVRGGPWGLLSRSGLWAGVPLQQECVTAIKVLLQGNCLACLHGMGWATQQIHIAAMRSAHDMRLAKQTSRGGTHLCY
jgi:hypothetical protein